MILQFWSVVVPPLHACHLVQPLPPTIPKPDLRKETLKFPYFEEASVTASLPWDAVQIPLSWLHQHWKFWWNWPLGNQFFHMIMKWVATGEDFFFHPPQNLEEEFHYCMHDKTESSGRLKGGKMERQCSGYTCSIILCPMEGLKINGNTSSAHCWTQRWHSLF